MKKLVVLLLIYLVFYNTILFANIILNKYGHIERLESQSSAEYYIEDGEYYINLNGNTLIGNSLFEIENGYLTLITIEENVPTWLRIYDKNSNLKFEKTFKKVINLKTSENKKYTAFFDGKYLQMLNNSTFQLEQFERSIIFDIDNCGNPIFADNNGKTHYKNRTYNILGFPRKIIFFQNKPLIFTPKKAFSIEDDLKEELNFPGNFFDAEVIDNSLYFVEKIIENEDILFNLYRTNNFINIEKLGEKILHRNLYRTHEPILAPLNYGTPNYPFPVGNSYGEIQEYQSFSYLHPGVDFLGNAYQEVYAVHDGFVKAVLSGGGAAYWQVAISNEDVSTETEGYLYAHLNQNSITVNVGDQVFAGDLLGTLYPWGVYNFTHLHFARLQDEGDQWVGTWWTIDNPHVDITNIQDTIPPIFENAIGNDLFAFRTDGGTYLDPNDLSGEFDIIAKCHDIENSNWRIDVWDISFSLHPAGDPNSTVYQQFSFAYDMSLDTYFWGSYEDIVLNTIYSRDATCYSTGNYEDREYYHIITNSNGDSLITEEDADEIFDSAQFSDGDYFIKVTTRDASLNITADSMLVYFNNGIINVENHQLLTTNYQLINYPNPFNPDTKIQYSIPADCKVELKIYNIKGQLVRTLIDEKKIKGKYAVIWDGKNYTGNSVSSGIYFYYLETQSQEGTSISTKKMILLR
jgi:murein DD-endopeptidase MepM/ murein hydrolase activator NlpD